MVGNFGEKANPVKTPTPPGISPDTGKSDDSIMGFRVPVVLEK
jgi:hypothetical protein